MLDHLQATRAELQQWADSLEGKVRERTEQLVAVQRSMAQSEKLASLGRLAAGVAHEINNPLGGILTFSMLAMEDCGPEHALHSKLDLIAKQALRCREIVRGLLDFSRQSEAATAATAVNGVVEKTLALLANQALFHNVKTVRDLAAELPPVLIDPGQLQQVLVNLGLNAVDAMDGGRGTLTVTTRYEPSRREVLVSVGDTGKGIPEDTLPLIFEPFFTTKKVGEGTGLGLSIVHGIVTRVGGKIEVQTSPSGTTFTMHFPIEEEGPIRPGPSGLLRRGGRS
jgi:two-component system NtrC family sensor kinase